MIDTTSTRDIRPRWVHVVPPGGPEATHGRCVMGLLVPEGVYVCAFLGPQAGILKGAWYIDPHPKPYPHGAHREFGSWHDAEDCHGVMAADGAKEEIHG